MTVLAINMTDLSVMQFVSVTSIIYDVERNVYVLNNGTEYLIDVGNYKISILF